MRANRLLVVAGLVFGLLAFAVPGLAEGEDSDGEFPDEKLKCKSEWAHAECNEGYALCSALGATCYYCETAEDQKVKNCREHEVTSTCKVEVNGPLYVQCGNKIKGTCVNNNEGGMKCQGTFYAHCGFLADFCKP